MCKIMEEYAKEYAKEYAEERERNFVIEKIKESLRKKIDPFIIADVFDLPMEKVIEIQKSME